MQTSFSPFVFEDSLVRVRLDGHGEPWFVAKDVCNVLDLGNVTEATRSLDDDERSEFRITEFRSDGIEQGRMYIAVSESGLYTLIFRSRKEAARRFRKWVTSEVLSAIRKSGSYHAAPALPGEPAALPPAVLAVKPQLRARVLDAAIRAAALTGISSQEEIEALFARFCVLVSASTAQLKNPLEDAVLAFTGSCLRPCEGGRIKAASMYWRFTRWWREHQGGSAPSMHLFGRVMRDICPKQRRGGNTWYEDVAWKEV